MKIKNRFFRSVSSLVGGLILSGVYHVIGFLIAWHWSQRLGEGMFFIGILLGPRGFEAQMAAIPIDFIAWWFIFGVCFWFVLRPAHVKREGWWPQNQVDKDH